MLTSTHPQSPYIKLFTLYLRRRLWKMSKSKHGVYYSSILEGSHLSDAGPVMDNSHFMALPQSHSSRVCSSRVVVVHLVCLACMIVQRGVLSVGAMRKSQFQWRTHECPVHWFLMRSEGMPSATWYFTLYGSSSQQSFTFLLPHRHWL